MGIKAGDLDVNIKHIDELTQQLRNNDMCDVLEFVLEEHLDVVKDLFDDIVKEKSKLLGQTLPIMTLPSPTPTSIVSWIGKLVAGMASPQLEATIKYTKKLIELGLATSRMIDAVEQVRRDNVQCLVSEYDQLVSVKDQLNSEINNALSQVQNIESSLIDAIGVGPELRRIDTSSPTNFLASVDTALAGLQQAVDEQQQRPLED